MNIKFKISFIIFLFISIMIILGSIRAQEIQLSTPERDSLLSIAREFIKSVLNCAL